MPAQPPATTRGRPAARPRLSFSGGTLLLERIPRQQVSRASGATPWVWDPRGAAWRCDALEYPSVSKLLREVCGQIEDEVPDWQGVRWPRVKLHTLRPDQQAAMDAWMAVRRGVVVMPTGTGKTE